MKTTEHLEFILLNIGYAKLNANWNWKNIYSPFARIYYVEEGEAKIHLNEKTYILKPKHLYMIPPFTLHSDECDCPFSLYYIHFYEEAFNKESLFDKYSFLTEVAGVSLDVVLMQRLLNINPNRHLPQIDPKVYDNQNGFSQYLALNNKISKHILLETKGILYQLLSRFFETRRLKAHDKNNKIKKSIKYIHENIGTNISVTHLAKLIFMSCDHFIRVFKGEIGYTPLRYINIKKIERAQLLLLTTDMNVREIAIDLSFDNISYFNRIFKMHTSKTPSQYRREYVGYNT